MPLEPVGFVWAVMHNCDEHDLSVLKRFLFKIHPIVQNSQNFKTSWLKINMLIVGHENKLKHVNA